MAELSKFWTGTTPGDAGAYSADSFADYMRNAFMALKVESGPFQGSGTSPDIGLTVQQTGVASANVQVTPGAAMVRGIFYELTATQQLTIAANGSGNPRIDTIILRASWALQTVRLAVLQGTPAATPAAPSLTQTDGVQWEIPLADIAVANGFATIVNANITYRRAFANTTGNLDLWDVLNNSGGILVEGDVVVWDTTTDRAVTTSTIGGDGKVAGVWVSRTAAGGYGRVRVRGVGRVNGKVAVARGNALIQSSTAKQADVAAYNTTGQKAFAFALASTAGAGLVECYINAQTQYQELPAMGQVLRTGAADYTTTSGTFADIDAANLIITLFLTKPTVELFATFTLSDSLAAGGCMFDFILDSTTRLGGASGSVRVLETVANEQTNIAMLGRFTGLSLGSHTFKLQYASVVNTQTTTIKNNGYPINFMAREV